MARITAAQWALLTKAEADLLRETEAAALASLNVDQVIALYDRVRRARTKFVTNYRRQASASVKAAGARGKVSDANARTAEKAELFEAALSRVSKRLAVVAQASSEALKQERLAAARSETPIAKTPKQSGPKVSTTGRKPTGGFVGSPAQTKRQAATRSTVARKQAKRDGR